MKLFRFLRNPKLFILNKAEEIAENKIKTLNLNPLSDIKENDVFLVAFPKSGITWLQSLIAGLQYGIDSKYLPDRLTQLIVPDIYVNNYYTRFGDIKIFKSHELPTKKYKKVIYLVRDGRDAMVSYYYFNKRLGVNVTLEDMILQNKNIYPSEWCKHVAEWLKNPYNSEIIYIRYEDLLERPFDVLSKILTFLNFNREKELIEKVIEGNSFKKMKEKAEKYKGLGHPNWQNEKGVLFFRKGVSGNYKEEMSSDLINYFNQKAHNELVHFDYEEVY